jgi:hypothetical protein
MGLGQKTCVFSWHGQVGLPLLWLWDAAVGDRRRHEFDSLDGCGSQGRAVNSTTTVAFEVHVFVPSVAPTDAAKGLWLICFCHIDECD